MGGTTTRARKSKATETEEYNDRDYDTPSAKADELNTRVKQLAMHLDQTEQKRDSVEAELRQAVAEVKFEQGRLRERQARLQSMIRRQHEAMHQLELKHVQAVATVAALERISLAQPLAPQRPAAQTSVVTNASPRIEQQDELHVPAASAPMNVQHQPGANICFTAADRASDIDELRSEASSYEGISVLSAALAGSRHSAA